MKKTLTLALLAAAPFISADEPKPQTPTEQLATHNLVGEQVGEVEAPSCYRLESEGGTLDGLTIETATINDLVLVNTRIKHLAATHVTMKNTKVGTITVDEVTIQDTNAYNNSDALAAPVENDPALQQEQHA